MAKKTSRGAVGCLIVMFFVIVIFIISVLRPAGPVVPKPPRDAGPVASKAPEAAESLSYGGLVMDAQDAVRRHLKFPHDATFDPGFLNGPQVSSKDGTVGIAGTVKTKNAFGAELTYEYMVLYQGSGDTVELLTVMIGGEFVYVSKAAKDNMENFIDRAAKAEERGRAAKTEELDMSYRTWTTNDRKFEVEAKFVGFKDGKVILQRRDNDKIINISPNQLSKADTEWYREELKRRNKKK